MIFVAAKMPTMKLICIVLFFTVFVCCTDKEIDKPIETEEEYKPVQILCTLSNNLDTVKLQIPGTWEWIEEKRWNDLVQKFDYLTPKTQGYTLRMKLNRDTITFYKNNVIQDINTYKILRQGEVTGTNYPDDENTVIVYYRIPEGTRIHFVPLKMCGNYMVLQHQYVSSVVGPKIWERR